MVDLLERESLKQSGLVEQRLASLEEQVGSGPGPPLLGHGLDRPGVRGRDDERAGEPTKRRARGILGAIVPKQERRLLRPPEHSAKHLPAELRRWCRAVSAPRAGQRSLCPTHPPSAHTHAPPTGWATLPGLQALGLRQAAPSSLTSKSHRLAGQRGSGA